MAKTASGKKSTYTHGYTRKDGTVVRNHYRSNPRTSKGKR